MESIKDNNRIFSKSFQNPLLCALGAIINDETIPKLKCKIVAGSANFSVGVGPSYPIDI